MKLLSEGRFYAIGYIRDSQTHEPASTITLKGDCLEDANLRARHH
ncbi:hypothetical protein [Citrobacter telavivensis]